MLESVVARLLNSILGRYVQELDAEGLNVGIFGGDVLLHGLKLKPSCLYELELPVEVVSGVIGELKLVIPWSCLSAKPIQVLIEDVLIVAHPVGVLPFDADREKHLLRALKAIVLERIEKGCSATIQSLLSTITPLLTHTVQLHVRGVHVRFEDPRSGFAAGLLLQEISVQTTNSKWKPVSSQCGNSAYQLMRLDAFAVYLNTGLHVGHFLHKDGDWLAHMRGALLQFQIKGAPLDFAVKPLNAKLKVIVGRGESAQAAPLLVDIVVQDAVLSVSHAQLQAVRHTMDLFNRIPLYREYLAFRPLQPVKSHSALWWRYAYRACLQQRVHPYTWTKLHAFRRDYRDYKEMYKQAVLHPGDSELKLDMQRREDCLSIYATVIARQHANIELRANDPDAMEVVEMGNRCSIRPIRSAKSFEQENVPLNFMEHKLNVTVDNMSLSVGRDGREVLCLGLTQALASLEARSDDAWKASARAGSLLLEGASADNELVPILATPANTHLGNNISPCFSLDVEKKALEENETTDWAVNVGLLPMELIYQEHAFSEILSWLPDWDWGGLFKSLCQQASEFASKSLVPRLDLHASLALPTIVLPESGSLQKSGLVVVVDLGKWDVATEFQPRLTVDEVAEMTQMELEERLYHRLQVTCSAAQVLFTDSGEEWRDLARREESDAHILSHLRTSITLSSSIKPDYHLLPRVKLNIGIPTIHITLSERRSQQLVDVLVALPLPAARRGLFVPPPPLWPTDKVQTYQAVASLTRLAFKVVKFELLRQRTPESLVSPLPLSSVPDLTDLQTLSGRSVVSDTSEEELELWARTVDLPGFEDNISPNNTITTLLRVTVGEFVCSLPRSIGFQDKPYLMLRLSRLSLDVAVMQYGPAVQLALGGLQLIDKLHIASSGEYLEVVSTQSDVDMFTLLYRKVRADCPDFKSHFHSVEESVVADVGRIALIVQREASLTMHKFLHDFVKRISKRIRWKGISWANARKWFPSNPDGPPVPSGGTKYSYSIHAALLSLRLRESDVDLMQLQAGGLEADWALRSNERLMLRMFLRLLSAEDLSEASLYPHVLTQDEDFVFEVKLVRWSPSVRRGIASGTLKLSLARLHVLAAAHIVHVMQRFSTLLSKASVQKSHSVIRKWSSHLPHWEGALQLSLSLHLPTVLLPPGSNAPSLLIVNLGDLSVENFLKNDANSNLVDNVLLRVNNFFITRGLMTLSCNVESREEIMEPVKVAVDAKRVLADVTTLDILATIDTIHIAIGQKDLSLLMQLYIANKSFAKLLEVLMIWKREEPIELKSLQAFLRDGNARRRDSSFRISLDTFYLTLYSDIDEQLSSPVRDQTHALCKLHVQDITGFLYTCVSGTCELRLSIHNCTLDDVRPSPCVVVKRVFGPRLGNGGDSRLDSAISVSTPPLVDVVGKQNERGDLCLDVMVERTRLNLSAAFLAALVHFCCDATLPDVAEGGCDNLGYMADTPLKSKADGSCCSEQIHHLFSPRQKGLSLSMQLRRPEVAFLADCGLGLVVRCELLLDSSQGPGRDELVLRLVGVRVSSLQPAPLVMRPCDVEVVRKVTGSGVQIAVGVGAVEFTLCSVVFTAFNAIFEEMCGAIRERRELPATCPAAIFSIDDLWSAKKIAPCCEAALCPVTGGSTEVCSNEPHSFPAGAPAQSLTVSMGTVKVVLGVQQGLTCRPMFIFKSECKLLIQDWTSAPTINGAITMEAAAWNDNAQTWESFLEPWTVRLDVYQNKALPISPCSARATRARRSDDTVPVPPQDGSESSGDESEPGMTFLKPQHFHLDAHRPCEILTDSCDSDSGEGSLERLRRAVAHLFVEGDNGSDSDVSSDEVDTDSASSDTARSPATERAVFLNKHSDSVDSGLETETVDRQATHVLIQASQLELSLTPNTLTAYQALFSPQLNTLPPLLTNHLGSGTRATLFKEGEVLIRCGFDEESPPSTPGSPSPCPSPVASSTSLEEEIISPDFSFNRLDIAELKARLSKKKLLVEIPGTEAQSLNVSEIVGVRTFNIPCAKQVYTVAVATKRQNGYTYHFVTSLLSILNNTSYAIGIYYKKTALESLGESAPGECSNPFDDMVRLAVVAPDDRYHVPLTVSCHCKLHFLPAHLDKHQISKNGLTWHETKVGLDTIHDVICENDAGEEFCMKAKCNIVNNLLKEVRLTPAWTVRNYLPCACEINLAGNKKLRLEAGEETNVYCCNPKDTCELGIDVPEYLGQPWSGVLPLGPDVKDKTVAMVTEKDTDGGNKHLTVCVLVTRSAPSTILFYAPYWLLNKTGLPLQVRSSGSDVIQELSGCGPLLFSHRKHRARTVRIRVLSSSWSPAFSLDAVGCSGLAICRDNERKKKYRLVVECAPCHVRPDLCRLVTFLPHLLVENVCRKHLRFMEDNEKADLWHDLNPSQCMPFWPDTDSLRMVVRLKDSKHISPAFPMAQTHTTALRVDKGCSLTVQVSGGEGHPLKITFRPYRVGDAPVRIDNYCADLFLKFRQRGCPQVALISPYHSLLYTWDDACKDRELLWSVYNNAGGELSATLSRDECGEERISFRTVRASPRNSEAAGSSGSSDSEPEPAPSPVRKNTRKDTVVVYWTSYLQGHQRVLLLTQDERLARRARKAVEAERTHLELLVTICDASVSLSSNASGGGGDVVRELAYAGVHGAPARWDLCVGQRWKTLPPELAAWLDNHYTHRVLQPKIKDYIHVDFDKMQMSLPLFGSLRRRQRPGLWVQYRSSGHLAVLQANIHRVQVDDQRHLAEVPCVLRAASSARSKPALEVSLLWRRGPDGADSAKFISVNAQEHCIHLDSDWLGEVCQAIADASSPASPQCAMRRDIAQMHAQRPSTDYEIGLVIEQLHCSDLKLDVTLVPSAAATTLMAPPSAATTLMSSPTGATSWPVPEIFAGFLATVAMASAPIVGLPIKLCGLNLSGGACSPVLLQERICGHYVTQLLQQLYVLVQGVHVLATPTARLATRVSDPQEELELPEEFSYSVRQELESRLTSQLASEAHAEVHSTIPGPVWAASRAFPLGCALAMSGAGMGGPRGTSGAGLDAFARGSGRAICALMTTLGPQGIPDPLAALTDAFARCESLGGSIRSRARPPRFTNPISGVGPFCMVEAQGVALLQSLGRGRYCSDLYWSHAPLTQSHSTTLLITLQRVILVEQVGESTQMEVSWAYALDSITNAELTTSQLNLVIEQGVEVSEKTLKCWEPEILPWLHARLLEAKLLSTAY